MQENDKLNSDIKITTTTDNTFKDKAEDGKNMRAIHLESGTVYKPAKEPPSECNPDNGAWFEERSNPLSSKGN
jgi:hypothetical protein